MNRVQGWYIPILTTCLAHGAITILPVNFGFQKEEMDTPKITFRLVSQSQISPQPSVKQVASLPKKKPLPPKVIQRDQLTAALPKPKARLQDNSEEKANPQETVRAEATPTTSTMASARPGVPSSTQMPQGPVMLSSELSVICPELTEPSYPRQSRQLGEYGDLMLKLELNVNGQVEVVQVISSSGYERLDEIAIAAVKTWRCNPPLRNGQPVRAIALQPFSFVLQ